MATTDRDQELVDSAIRFLFDKREELTSGRIAVDRLKAEFPGISDGQIMRSLEAITHFWASQASQHIRNTAARLAQGNRHNRHFRRAAARRVRQTA